MSKVFKAPARFDASAVADLRQEIDRLAATNGDVVIDFARTEVLDGSGVGAMVYAFKRLVAGGNRLTVRNVSGQPLNLLNDSGLLRTLSADRRADRRDGFFRATMRRVRPQPVLAATLDTATVAHAASERRASDAA